MARDLDDFYLNLAVYEMEAVLEDMKNPRYNGTFVYGRPKIGHRFFHFDPWPMKLLQVMAEHISANAPEGEDTDRWKYD